MSTLDEDQIELARSLAHPTDKNIRDRTVKELKRYLTSIKSMSELDMLKLWKALHYCMWLADKPEVQQELAMDLTRMLHIFQKQKLTTRYFEIFCRTMLREWPLLDQHRMNKFMMFLRYMIKEMFCHFLQSNWNSIIIQSLLNVLDKEILQKTPNGLRYHITDIYVDELYTVADDISTDNFVLCLQPFLYAIHYTTDQSYLDRIIIGIFHKFLSNYAIEHFVSNEVKNAFLTTNIDSNGNDKKYFTKVKTTVLQALIFDIAGSEDISEANRKKVYKMHKEFQIVTRQEFVDFMEDKNEDRTEESTEIVVVDKTISSFKKKTMVKKKRRLSESLLNDDKEGNEDYDVYHGNHDDNGHNMMSNKKKSKIEKRSGMTMDSSTIVTPTRFHSSEYNDSMTTISMSSSRSSPSSISKSMSDQNDSNLLKDDQDRNHKSLIKNTKGSHEVTSPPINVKSTQASNTSVITSSVKKNKKQLHSLNPPITTTSESKASTTVTTTTTTTTTSSNHEKESLISSKSSLATIKTFDASLPVSSISNEDKPGFIASTKFTGSKPGYKFQKGNQGIGYYIDTYKKPTKKASILHSSHLTIRPTSSSLNNKPSLNTKSSNNNSNRSNHDDEKSKKKVHWRR